MIKGILGEVPDGRDRGMRHLETMFRYVAYSFKVGTELLGSRAKV